MAVRTSSAKLRKNKPEIAKLEHGCSLPGATSRSASCTLATFVVHAFLWNFLLPPWVYFSRGETRCTASTALLVTVGGLGPRRDRIILLRNIPLRWSIRDPPHVPVTVERHPNQKPVVSERNTAGYTRRYGVATRQIAHPDRRLQGQRSRADKPTLCADDQHDTPFRKRAHTV